MTTMLTHNRVQLALHRLRGGDGQPLLLLHGLGERSPEQVPDHIAPLWFGPIWALDFTGHGASTVPRGGGYTAEILMADADVALAHTGPATVLGRGLGAYVALLLAGARPELVRGAVLCDGPGLLGGGAGPSTPSVVAIDVVEGEAPDPHALHDLARDPRPPDYATSFARQAAHLSGLDTPVSVCAKASVGWLDAIVNEPGVQRVDLATALATYAP